jgi:nucleosome binding factor SPN SPT16 subunit
LSEEIDKLVQSPDEMRKLLAKDKKKKKPVVTAASADADMDQVDTCFPTIIQSGGKYNLKPSAER